MNIILALPVDTICYIAQCENEGIVVLVNACVSLLILDLCV